MEQQVLMHPICAMHWHFPEDSTSHLWCLMLTLDSAKVSAFLTVTGELLVGYSILQQLWMISIHDIWPFPFTNHAGVIIWSFYKENHISRVYYYVYYQVYYYVYYQVY